MPLLVFHNGELVPASTPLFSVENRAWRYGDALFETMKVSGGRLLFADDHYVRLTRGMAYLGMEIPQDFTPEYLASRTESLARENGFVNARTRLQVFRNDGGLYAPATNAVSIVMEAQPLPHAGYVYGGGPLHLGVYPDYRIPVAQLSNIKTCNRLPNVMAARHAAAYGYGDCLLINEDGNIAEAISSNVFVVSNGILLTPPLTDGCIGGIMRRQVIALAQEAGLERGREQITLDVLADAGEIFLTNVIVGIRSCTGYRKKMLDNAVALRLSELLGSRVENAGKG